MLLPLWEGLAEELGIGPGTPLLWTDCIMGNEILFFATCSDSFIFHHCRRGGSSSLPILAIQDVILLEQWVLVAGPYMSETHLSLPTKVTKKLSCPKVSHHL
jgi:hypothetical protein